MAKAIGAYLGDSLKIFLLPVSTISGAAERNLPLVQAGAVLLTLTLCAELVRLGIGFVPGGSAGAASSSRILLDSVTYMGFFLIALLVMFALMIVFGAKNSLRRLLSAKLDLAAAVLGGFLIAFVFKAAIATLFLGATDGSAGLLINIGEQIGLLALAAIIGVYGIIVLRFGGGLSWLLAVIAGIIHFALMVGIFGAYSLLILQNDLSAVQQLLQS